MNRQDINDNIEDHVNNLPEKEVEVLLNAEYIIQHGTAKNNADFALLAYDTDIDMFYHCKVIATGTAEENLNFVWSCYRKFIANNEHIEETLNLTSLSGSLMKFVCCNFTDSYKWGPVFGADYDRMRINKIDVLVHCLAASEFNNGDLKQVIIGHYTYAVNNNYFFHLNHTIAMSLTRYLAANQLQKLN